MIAAITMILLLLLLIESVYLYTHIEQIIKMINSIQKFENVNIKIYSALLGYFFMTIAFYISSIRYEFTYLDILLLGISINGIHQAFSNALFNNWNIILAIMNTLWGGILFVSITFLYRNIIS